MGEKVKKKIEDFTILVSGLNGKTAENFGKGSARYVPYIDVYKKTIISNGENLPQVEIAEGERQNLLLKGDILLTSSSETPEEVALAAVYDSDDPAYLNSFCFALRPDQQTAVPLYVAYFLRSPAGRKIIRLYSQGSTRYNLARASFLKYSLALPSLPEQQKIADFFTLLDERIGLQENKIALLEQQKQGYMKKLFNRELRFRAEDGSEYPGWEDVLLESYLKVPLSKELNFEQGDFNLITVKLHMQGVDKNKNTATLKNGATKYYKRHSGQFIYGKQNLFNGAFGIVPEELDGFGSSIDIPAFEIDKEKIVPQFLLYYFSRKSYYKSLEKFATGTGSKRIQEKVFLKLPMETPQLEEQMKIATFLKALDLRLETEKKKLTLLKLEKQYYLKKIYE